MATTLAQLQQWLEEPEGTRLEFKQVRTDLDLRKLAEYCVALADKAELYT